jgi:tetratricopeptide (TPR) repeat protein/uncharacterized Rossmann fold enzyme
MNKPQFFVNSFGDRYLHDVNRGVFDRLGATAVFEQHFGKKLFAKDALHIVVGTDSGALVRHVRRKGVPEGSRYLFLELDGLLPVIRAELANEELDENIHLVGQDGLPGSLHEVRFPDYASIGAILLHESIGALDGYCFDYRLASSEIKQQLDSILWVYNTQLSNPTFIRSQLKNLIEEHVPATALRDTMVGHTAVLLGGGPSLDDILPWVQQHQSDVVVFAVSRICRRLRDAGVTPHIVVSIDPTELSFDISKELLLLDPRVIFAHANHVHFPLLAQWRGRSVYMDRLYPWDNETETENIRSIGPTVTNTAFGLAGAMGFTRIVFGGIDLCLSAEGFSHARGSNEYDAGPRLGGAGMRVKTNSDANAETTPDFFNAIQSLGGQASRAGQAGIKVLNPAPGAAAIEGVDYVALDDIDIEPLASGPFELLHARLPEDSAAERTCHLSAMQKELARCNGRLRKVVDLAEQALECNDGLFGRNGKVADFKFKKRMDKIERQLDNKLKDVSEIVKMFSARAFLHMPPSDREWTDEEIEQAGKTYYTAYRDNAREVVKLVEEAQQRIQVAVIEEADAPDFERLLAQWKKDGIPGRAGTWCYRHPEAATQLPDAVRARFNEMDALFKETLNKRETSHLEKVRSEAKLGPVRSKLQLLFREQNADELTNTLAQLLRQDGSEARQLEQLARGYLSELSENPAEAFEQFANLIELAQEDLGAGVIGDANPRLEDGLRRMVVIAMSEERFDKALLILETLSDLAPTYKPQYAELLRLSGDPEAAANVYTDYLSKAPGDLATMLRLGKLYQGMGVADAAKTAFSYVLKNEPENTTAKTLLQQVETAA